jgi:hypothetical protein
LLVCVGLQGVNAAGKILDVRAALSLRDRSIACGSVGGFPHSFATVFQDVRESLKIVAAVCVALVGRQAVPSQGFAIVLLHTLPELMHPT